MTSKTLQKNMAKTAVAASILAASARGINNFLEQKVIGKNWTNRAHGKYVPMKLSKRAKQRARGRAKYQNQVALNFDEHIRPGQLIFKSGGHGISLIRRDGETLGKIVAEYSGEDSVLYTIYNTKNEELHQVAGKAEAQNIARKRWRKKIGVSIISRQGNLLGRIVSDEVTVTSSQEPTYKTIEYAVHRGGSTHYKQYGHHLHTTTTLMGAGDYAKQCFPAPRWRGRKHRRQVI